MFNLIRTSAPRVLAKLSTRNITTPTSSSAPNVHASSFAKLSTRNITTSNVHASSSAPNVHAPSSASNGPVPLSSFNGLGSYPDHTINFTLKEWLTGFENRVEKRLTGFENGVEKRLTGF